MSKLSRRRFIKGTLNGGVVTVALPFLNCFLNENGTALANGAPIPMRFGTWSWGLGMSEAIFVPATRGLVPVQARGIRVLPQDERREAGGQVLGRRSLSAR